MIFFAISPVVVPAIGAVIGLLGVLTGLWVNGDRAERQRKRDLHARALAAVLAYGEMPFMIRRRRCEEDQQSGERVRLSDHFSAVKAEVSTCQVLLAADGDHRVSEAYGELVEVMRATVGAAAHKAWTEAPIRTDTEMNMGPLYDSLEEFRAEVSSFENALARATLPRRKRLVRTLRRS
jgi:hypothetical protein